MSDRAQHRMAATIDDQIGHGGALLARRVSAWRLWTVIAKWLGLIVILLMYIPLVWLAVMSFSGKPLSGIPYPLTMEHYDELMGAFNKWGEPLYESIAMGVVVGIVCMIVATAVGRAMPRMKKPGGVILIALIPLFVPGLTMGRRSSSPSAPSSTSGSGSGRSFSATWCGRCRSRCCWC